MLSRAEDAVAFECAELRMSGQQFEVRFEVALRISEVEPEAVFEDALDAEAAIEEP